MDRVNWAAQQLIQITSVGFGLLVSPDLRLVGLISYQADMLLSLLCNLQRVTSSS
jgi:hypothetical protein